MAETPRKTGKAALPPGEDMATILAADIGGTSSRFGLFTIESGGTLSLERTDIFETADAESFSDLVSRVSELDIDIDNVDTAVFAVPGAVNRGVFVSMPNVTWNIDLEKSSNKFYQDKLTLINDFKAQAYATRTEAIRDAKEIKTGQAVEDATVAVVGAGTGLGHAAVTMGAPGRITAVASEMGHIAFSFIGEEEEAFHAFLRKKLSIPYGYGDLVVTGPGLSHIHEFLIGERLEPKEVSERAEPRVMEWFSRFYGRAARHYALAVVAQGGVYIAGGVAAKNPSFVDCDAFRNEFVLSPTYGYLLEKIPVWLNRNEKSGLWGAGYLGAQKLDLVS